MTENRIENSAGREVIVAEHAGFCFGVKRAVEEVYRQAQEGAKPVYTYGPIIHNEEVVADLEKRGVHALEGAKELSQVHEGTIIIRSHGVEKKIYDQITAQGLTLVDATCPFVKKIHRIVAERSSAGDDIIVIGSASHPEVQGIVGWSSVPVTVIGSEEEAKGYTCTVDRPLTIVSQTTFNYEKFNKIVEILTSMRYDNYNILNTICNATEERQTEAKKLAAGVDAMIVIGGKTSSNTQKLFEICKKECANTYYIQKLADFDIRLLPSRGCVGITAGASTPNKLIEEVSKHVRNEF